MGEPIIGAEPENVPPAIREAVWTVDNGAVRIRYPYPMASDDVDDIEAYLALWLRGLRRAVAAKVEQPPQPDVGSATLTRDAK